MTALRALIVEDSTDDAELLLRTLGRGGYKVVHERVQTAAAMKTVLQEQQWDIIFSDWSMPQFDATEALRVLQETKLDVPFIIVSGTVGEEVVVAALRSGAHDFFSKGNLVLLLPAVERELREASIRQERARIEQQLFSQTVELQKVNDLLSHQLELKNMFLTAVSHELRTPLTSIVVATTELASRWVDFADDERRELIGMAHSQSVDMSALIEDLLVAGRMEAGTVSVVCQPVAVDDELKRVIESLDKALSQRVQNTAAHAMALADPIRLRQILRNLLLNANRHGGPDILVEVAVEGGRVQIRVADNGNEIPEKERNLIFEPFYGSISATGLAPSVGLGLTISTTLARMMDGGLTYRYENGWGAFILDLPGA